MKINRDTLYLEYVVNEKSIREIASERHVSVGCVFNSLNRFGIPTRKEVTEKTRQKISKANLGKPSPTKGTIRSEATKKKMSEARKGRVFKRTKYGGHSKVRSDGYVAIYNPSHPNSNNDGYVMEHVLVVEESLGRFLAPDEVVHHKNHIRNDNRIENLQLMTFKEHASLHMKERWAERKKGNGTQSR